MFCDGWERDGIDAMQEWQDGNMDMLKGIRTDECFSLSSPKLSCFPSVQDYTDFCCALMVWVHVVPWHVVPLPWQKALNQAVCLPGLCLFPVLLPWCARVFVNFTLMRDQNLEPENMGQNDLAAMDPRNHHRVVFGVYGAVLQAPLDYWLLLCVRAMGFLSLFLQKAAETEISM